MACVFRFDATENDVPSSAGFRVQGFPTIKFKPAGSRDFIDYEGASPTTSHSLRRAAD